MKGCLNQLPQSSIDNKKHIVDFPLQPVKLQLRKPQKSEQASIRLGRILVPKNHADYPALFFVNLILGGYFGSRLMQNIREQNALTYNIYSTVETVLHAGYFQLSTEVHHKKVDIALKEIYAEIEKMYLEKVNESELKMVKNYYFGQVLSATDGIFNLSKLYREWTCAQLEFEHFHQFLDEIININSELVANISEKYLKIEYLSEIVVD
jgi:predicted Zn-dependent peptidase